MAIGREKMVMMSNFQSHFSGNQKEALNSYDGLIEYSDPF